MGGDSIGENAVHVFLFQITGKSTTIQLKKGDTVDDLYNGVQSKTGIQVKDFNLVFTSKQLLKGEGKTLKEYKIIHLSTVRMVMYLDGGGNAVSTRSLLPLPPNIKVVYNAEADMITLDRDPTVPKAEMPCGHVITQDSMTQYCRSILKQGNFIFICPFRGEDDDFNGKGCEEEFPYYMVRHVACLDPGEQHEIENKIAENYFNRKSDIRQCPGCGNYSQRKKTSDKQVKCPVCSKANGKKYYFCWDCLGEWGARDHSSCSMVFALRYLNGCGTKDIGRVKGCPIARACPNPKCFALIEHKDRCKHMRCPNCEISFCFVCLEQKDKSGNYECGGPFAVCEIAPIQNTFA